MDHDLQLRDTTSPDWQPSVQGVERKEQGLDSLLVLQLLVGVKWLSWYSAVIRNIEFKGS